MSEISKFFWRVNSTCRAFFTVLKGQVPICAVQSLKGNKHTT